MYLTHTLNTSTHSSPHESQSTERQGRSSTKENEMKSGTTKRTPREKAPARNSSSTKITPSSNDKPSSKSVKTPKNTTTHKEASSKVTAVNQSSPSIRNFFDPVTGKRTKRKIPDTAPERNEKDNKVKKGKEKEK